MLKVVSVILLNGQTESVPSSAGFRCLQTKIAVFVFLFDWESLFTLSFCNHNFESLVIRFVNHTITRFLFLRHTADQGASSFHSHHTKALTGIYSTPSSSCEPVTGQLISTEPDEPRPRVSNSVKNAGEHRKFLYIVSYDFFSAFCLFENVHSL